MMLISSITMGRIVGLRLRTSLRVFLTVKLVKTVSSLSRLNL